MAKYVKKRYNFFFFLFNLYIPIFKLKMEVDFFIMMFNYCAPLFCFQNNHKSLIISKKNIAVLYINTVVQFNLLDLM